MGDHWTEEEFDAFADRHECLPGDDGVSGAWVETCGLCLCGEPSSAASLLLQTLEAVEDGSAPPTSTPQDWLILYLLDSMGLTEHGGSVSRGRLTSDGAAALSALREVRAAIEARR